MNRQQQHVQNPAAAGRPNITTAPGQASTLSVVNKGRYINGEITVNGLAATSVLRSSPCGRCVERGTTATCRQLRSDPAGVFPRASGSGWWVCGHCFRTGRESHICVDGMRQRCDSRDSGDNRFITDNLQMVSRATAESAGRELRRWGRG